MQYGIFVTLKFMRDNGLTRIGCAAAGQKDDSGLSVPVLILTRTLPQSKGEYPSEIQPG